MTARGEERTYRSSCKKCVRGEAKARLLEGLLEMKLGVRDIEEFIIRDRNTFKGGGVKNDFNSKIKKHEEERLIVENIMKRRLRENSKLCVLLRKERAMSENRLIAALGGKNRVFKGIVKDTKKNSEKLKTVLRMKNVRKTKWLREKYEVKIEGMEEMTEVESEKYGMVSCSTHNLN